MDQPVEVAAVEVATDTAQEAVSEPSPTEQISTNQGTDAKPVGDEAPEPPISARDAMGEQPKRRADRKRAMQERIAQQAKERALRTEKSQQAQEQPRNEDGTFKAPVAADQVATQEPEPAAVEVAESVPDEPTQEQLIRIALDQRNPLFDQGRQEIAIPAAGLSEEQRSQLERDIRTLANASVRSREVDQTRANYERAREEIAVLNARLEAIQSGSLPDASDPEVAQLLADIEQHYPNQKDLVQKALASLQRDAMAEKEQTARRAVQLESVARNFIMQTEEVASQKYPLWAATGELAQRMQRARAQYGDYVDARNNNLQAVGKPPMMPDAKEFFNWVDTHYVADPRVKQQLKTYQEKQQSKAKEAAAAQERQRLAEAEKLKLQDAADRHSTRPPSPPLATSQGRVSPPQTSSTPAELPHGNRQRALRNSIRQRLMDQQR